MASPTLSVLLPNYNHVEYLPRCLDAILGQSFRDFELIIVDDASTDDSVRVIEEYANRDDRIRFYKNAQNRGVVPTLNRALELARGEFAHGAASDDYVLPGYFQDAIDLLRLHPQAGLALGLTDCVNDEGRLKYVVPGNWSDDPAYLSPDALCDRIGECGIPGPAIWRRELFLKTGGYNPDLKWHCDWFALQVVAFRHGVCFLPQKTTVVRLTDGAYSQAGQSKPKTQRPVLQRLLTEVAAPAHRDVLPCFRRSGAFRQFGPELVRAAALMETPSPEVVWCLHDFVFTHAATILREPDPKLRSAVVRLLARYGKAAIPFYHLLGTLRTDPDLGVRVAAADARWAIWRSSPLRTTLRQLRRTVGKVVRRVERSLRPLHYEQQERMNTLLQSVVSMNQQVHNALCTINSNLERLVASGNEKGSISVEDKPRRAA